MMTKGILVGSLLGLLLAAAVHAQEAPGANCSNGNAATGDPASTTTGPGGQPLALDGSGAPPPPPPGRGPQLTAEEMTALQAMTEEQRKAFFDQKRQAFLATLTPEQRAEHEARQKERAARFAAMTPEQKAAMKARFGQRGGDEGGRGARHGGGRRGPPPGQDGAAEPPAGQ